MDPSNEPESMWKILLALLGFVAVKDLPIYGKMVAYGVGLAALGIGAQQVLKALGELVRLLS